MLQLKKKKVALKETTGLLCHRHGGWGGGFGEKLCSLHYCVLCRVNKQSVLMASQVLSSSSSILKKVLIWQHALTEAHFCEVGTTITRLSNQGLAGTSLGWSSEPNLLSVLDPLL